MKFMIIPSLFFCIAGVVYLAGCKQQHGDYPLMIEQSLVLDSIPSGSGIVVRNDTAYIIGDDATALYSLNIQNSKQEKIPVAGLDFTQYRELKPVKHDFESATLFSWKGNEYLFAFGSGTKVPQRDSMLMVRISDFSDSKIISLEKCSRELRRVTQTDSTQWNIEGVTVVNDMLFLFNRGNNLIIKCKADDLLSYLLGEQATFPNVEYDTIKMPSIQDREARLSGACTWDSTHIIFSASVEDTPDWTKDGPVLGSYIGIYSLGTRSVVGSYLLQDEAGIALKEKIESVDILPGKSKDISLVAIGDNDNGATNFYRLKLSLSIFKK